MLAAALAAGIPLPHSCREGRCASCKAKLLSGEIRYPNDRLPPGLTAAEAAQGEVLLCQARPRSELVVETRRMPLRPSAFASCELLSIDALPLRALRVRLRILEGGFEVRAGQYVDVRDPAGDAERLAVIAISAEAIDIESTPDGSALRAWLDSSPSPGSSLRVAGPFDRPA